MSKPLIHKVVSSPVTLKSSVRASRKEGIKKSEFERLKSNGHWVEAFKVKFHRSLFSSNSTKALTHTLTHTHSFSHSLFLTDTHSTTHTFCFLNQMSNWGGKGEGLTSWKKKLCLFKIFSFLVLINHYIPLLKDYVFWCQY